MFKSCLALICAVGFFSAVECRAQENEILTELYGTGVHAYFAADYKTAYADLTGVIDRGTKDPRAYYFRAMTYLKLGRPDEAAADMQQGADLESQDVDGTFNVSRSLERVQGKGRQALEKHRLQARLATYKRQQQADNQKYEQNRRRERDVLRTLVEVPLDGGPAVVRTAPPAEEVKPAIAETPVEPTATVEEGDVPAAVPAAEADPFGTATDVKPAPPAGDNPFGDNPADAPADVKPAPPADNPDDPFGTTEPEMKKADPAGEDPFSDDNAVPADDAPAGEKPAPADPDDPFGAAPAAGEKPAAEASADDDPFGAAPAAGEKPASAPADNPFADEGDEAEKMEEDTETEAAPAPADDDPFGAAPAAGEKPAAKAPAAAADDPFADEADEAEKMEEDTETEAAAELPADDPFANDSNDAEKVEEEKVKEDKKPAAAADDNPFE